MDDPDGETAPAKSGEEGYCRIGKLFQFQTVISLIKGDCYRVCDLVIQTHQMKIFCRLLCYLTKFICNRSRSIDFISYDTLKLNFVMNSSQHILKVEDIIKR